MSLYTPWGAYNLSPTPNVLGPKPPTTNKQSVVDTHHPELQYGFNLAVPNCPRALNDHKSIHDARSINNYFVRPNPDRSTALPSADLGYAGYSLLPHNHADVSFPTTRHSVSPTESPHYWISSGPLSSTYEPFNHRDALMPQNAPRSFWNEEPVGTLNSESLPRVLPAISPQAYTSNVSNYPTYYPHQAPRSKAALFAEEWDHPSFARPPHQPIAQKSVAAVPRIATFPVIQALGLSSTPNEVDQPHESGELLVPDSYPVPPPPPYEQSAAPLADLAAKMVWERTVNSFPLRASSMPPPTSDLLSPAVDSGFSWGPTLSETRSPYDACYPLTRFGSQRDTAYTNHRHSIAASVFGVIGAEVKARREQHSQQQAIQPLKSDVKPAFKQWTRQVLEETLLSPQVLVLALYYVDMLRGKDVFGDVARGKSSLVPYKMLLAGLVLANKTLDDHSYKNSVSNAHLICPVKNGPLTQLDIRIAATPVPPDVCQCFEHEQLGRQHH